MPLSDETLEILDPYGLPLGKSKFRSLVHRDGDWHATAHVWIVNAQGGLLLQKRSEAKESHPGLWDISSAGHVVAGQTSVDAALCEAREELGLAFDPEDVELIFTLRNQCLVNNGAFIDNEISDVYLVTRAIDDSRIVLQTSEVSAIRWIYYKDLRVMLKSSPNEFVAHEEEYKKLFMLLEKRF